MQCEPSHMYMRTHTPCSPYTCAPHCACVPHTCALFWAPYPFWAWKVNILRAVQDFLVSPPKWLSGISPDLWGGEGGKAKPAAPAAITPLPPARAVFMLLLLWQHQEQLAGQRGWGQAVVGGRSRRVRDRLLLEQPGEGEAASMRTSNQHTSWLVHMRALEIWKRNW